MEKFDLKFLNTNFGKHLEYFQIYYILEKYLVTTHFWNQPEQHLYDIEQFVCMVSIEFLSGVFNIVALTVSNV